MSRNMVDANQKVFDKIIDYVNMKDQNAGIVRAKRYIATNADDKEWLKNITIECVKKISFSAQSILFSYNEENYFVFVGWTDLACDKDEIDEITICAGVFTALVAEAGIEIRREILSDELVENILSQHEDQKYCGHSFNDLLPFFQPFSIYKVKKTSPLLCGGIDRVSAFFLATNSTHLALSFSSHTLASFEKLCLEGNAGFDYGTTLACLSAVSWDYAFLSLYRPLERLFSLPKVLELRDKIISTISVLDFSAEIERCTGWRPKEDDALESLLSRDGISPILAPIKDVSMAVLGGSADVPSKFIYKIRNSIVHFRPATQTFDLADAQWDKLVGGLCEVVNDLYNFYGAHLTGIPTIYQAVEKVESQTEDTVPITPPLTISKDACLCPHFLSRFQKFCWKVLRWGTSEGVRSKH